MEKEKNRFDIKKHITRVLINEPFFAALSRYIDKVETTTIPTAGVTVGKYSQNYTLLYNSEFFNNLANDKQRLGILKHEYYHLILNHVTGRTPGDYKDKKNNINSLTYAKIWNIATDLSINSFLPRDELPDICLFPGEGQFKEYALNLSAEQYYNMLKKDKNIVKYVPMDSHEGWGNEKDGDGQDEASKAIAKEKLKNALTKAANECANNNSWGNISHDMRKLIINLINPVIDWKNVLRYFVKTSKRSSKRSTIRRINKRYPYIHPGKKIIRQANIAISIDQSGSVSDDLLISFFAELDNLSSIAEFTVIPFDHSISKENIYIWKKGQKRKCERVLDGGTDFNPPTTYVNDSLKFDGHIILTDMQAPKPIASICKRLWMTNEDGAARPYFKTNEIIIPIISRTSSN